MQSSANPAALRRPRIDGARLWDDVMALARHTEPAHPYTRRSFSPLFAQGRAWLAQRFADAALTPRVDAAGNLVGRRPGLTPGARTIMVGSHTDTVPEGGRFDGIVGVLAGLEMARALKEAGVTLEHAFEVVDFLAEEPSEFGVSCVGSRALVGALSGEQLATTSPQGLSLGEAIRALGGDPASLGALPQRADLAAFLELHIEQGPVLEATQTQVGIVTSIVGITRLEMVFEGAAAHAGTAPMRGRQDAAVAAAGAVLAVRELAQQIDRSGQGYFVATCGIVDVRPGASNVVPGQARVVVDARAELASAMERFLDLLSARVQAVAADSSCMLTRWQLLSRNAPTACDPGLQQTLQDAAQSLGLGHRRMASGAGHDAAFVARIAPAGMLFVPCRAGRSHCPEEWIEPEQLAIGAAVMLDALLRLDRGAPAAGGGLRQ